MNSTEAPGFSASNCLPIAVRLLIIDDDANTVMVVVEGCDGGLQAASEITKPIPVAIANFNWPRIDHDHTDTHRRDVSSLPHVFVGASFLCRCRASAVNQLVLHP
jgi:hypothetical protein